MLVSSVCLLIVWCTTTQVGENQNNEDRVIVKVILKKFVERDGVHTMLLANDEYTGGRH